jgi:hypothetical protein
MKKIKKVTTIPAGTPFDCRDVAILFERLGKNGKYVDIPVIKSHGELGEDEFNIPPSQAIFVGLDLCFRGIKCWIHNWIHCKIRT